MSINQEFLTRLTVETQASAKTLPYRVGEITTLLDTGVVYIYVRLDRVIYNWTTVCTYNPRKLI